jgi:aspartate kinase
MFISYGEIISSTIIYHYLIEQNANIEFINANNYIRTDSTWREGEVDWEWTEKNIQKHLLPIIKSKAIITQGFIGGTVEGNITTLGREGSDYTASIFAYCLDAESVTTWKDVDGILNADPKVFENTSKYDSLTYNEATEMTYYGASVIHPKTIKPLANKNIPLYVKSFLNPEAAGTKIADISHEKIAPAYIKKENQVLISFHVKDFSFITENNLSTIFYNLSKLHIKINMMQNSALSFSVCIDFNEKKIELLKKRLQSDFKIQYNNDLVLFTIKNHDADAINKITVGKTILVEQKTRSTYQVLTSKN